jgi:hypothetical protein
MEMAVRYTVRIVGHEPPYKWKVFRHMRGAAPAEAGTGTTTPDASYSDALFQAAEVARQREWLRIHERTVREELLFEVGDDGEPLQAAPPEPAAAPALEEQVESD